MRHYAVSWPYGSINWGSAHGLPGEVFSFASKAERDLWVNAGSQYGNTSGYREAITCERMEWLERRDREVIAISGVWTCDTCGKVCTELEAREHTLGFPAFPERDHLTYTNLQGETRDWGAL